MSSTPSHVAPLKLWSIVRCTHRCVLHTFTLTRRQVAMSPILTAVLTLALIATSTLDAIAQTPPARTSPWAFIMSSGALVPTGPQRDVVSTGALSTAQLSYAVRPALAFSTTLGWARSRDLTSTHDPKLDVITYDIGAELQGPRWFEERSITLRPFMGGGAGGRRYAYRSLDLDATHQFTTFASVGGELSGGRVGVRLEARHNLTAFRPLNGQGDTHLRSDLAFMAGLRLIKS